MVDILILEPDPAAAAELVRGLPARLKYRVVITPSEAEAFLDEFGPRLFLCADDLPDEPGLMFLARTEKRWPSTKRVLMAPDLDGELFFHAMSEVTIFSYLNKPVDRGELIRTIHHAVLDRDRFVATEPESRAHAPEPASWVRILLLTVLAVLAAALVLLVLVTVFFMLYRAKSVAGIDLFPETHLSDLFRR